MGAFTQTCTHTYIYIYIYIYIYNINLYERVTYTYWYLLCGAATDNHLCEDDQETISIPVNHRRFIIRASSHEVHDALDMYMNMLVSMTHTQHTHTRDLHTVTHTQMHTFLPRQFWTSGEGVLPVQEELRRQA
jgi:hypothetical protein